MTTFTPRFRSPIRGTALNPNPLFSVSDLSGVPVVLIQGAVEELLQKNFGNVPNKPNQMVRAGDGLLARLTATQFYLFGTSPETDLPSAATLESHFREATLFAHATDYRDGVAVLRLQGSAAPDLLSKICGLDLNPSKFPDLHVAQTSVARIKTLVARCDDSYSFFQPLWLKKEEEKGQTPGYYLHVDAPSGQYFWETVLDAGQEFVEG